MRHPNDAPGRWCLRLTLLGLPLVLACESVTSVRPYTNECHPDRYYTEMQDTTPELKAVQAWCKAQREESNAK